MELEAPSSNNGGEISNSEADSFNANNGIYEDLDSKCSTPYVSAPSSPGRPAISGLFYSAPASPMHFALTVSSFQSSDNTTAEFEFSARFGSTGSGCSGSMSSADELFLNGQIRPMKLSTHLERPQLDLLDLEGDEEAEAKSHARGRDLRLRDKSVRRRTRSMSPLRITPFEDGIRDSCLGKEIEREKIDGLGSEATPSSSRSSSAGRSSKRWVFLKDFLYRSKSEGTSNNKFWSTISKDKKPQNQTKKAAAGKPANGVGKRPSPHELHYKAHRAQAEELRKKTFLPYRQGLFGCLGFSSKGYGAVNGFARALNPVSSR